MFLRKKNCARTTLSSGITAGATVMTVADPSQLPSTTDFLVTIWNKSIYADPCDDPNHEIVRVTGIAGNMLTITRGQEDTTGVIHAGGHAVEQLITAYTFVEIEEAIPSLIIGEDLSSQADGANTTFTLSGNYETNSVALYLNGLRQQRGSGKDYTESGANTIEFDTAPESTDIVIADYLEA